jgi:hypothetical protein
VAVSYCRSECPEELLGSVSGISACKIC